MKLCSISNPEVEQEFPEDFIGTANPVENWEKLNRIGEGTYGIVYRARHMETNHIVALKKVRMEQENDGLPISSLREISLLKSLKHPNVINVHEVAVGYDLDNIFLVMEYCEHDMAFLMDNVISKAPENAYKPAEVKCLMYQLVKGLSYLHKHYVVHRDLKLSNLLLTSSGKLKIADFGLARKLAAPKEGMTPKVVTLWYRSPELLLGASNYSLSIDIWSLGCIFGEFITSKPLLPGKTEKHQLELITLLLGTPTKKIWPGLKKLPLAKSFSFGEHEQEYHTFKEQFNGCSNSVMSLVQALLKYDPKKRLTIEEVLTHTYFSSKDTPAMCTPEMLPSYPELRYRTTSVEEEAAENAKKRTHDEMIAEDEESVQIIGPFNKI